MATEPDAALDEDRRAQAAADARLFRIVLRGLFGSVVLTAVFLVWFVGSMFTIDESNFKFLRKSLPKGATNVRDMAFDHFPDFTYILRADMPESDFNEFVESQGEMEHLYEGIYTFYPEATPVWWTPAMAGVKSYRWSRRDGQLEMHLQYYRGTMYMVYWSE